ncbi:MAG: apolipoprotein N-acyltransferase [Gemmatimonadota bacterium]|nr:MAG: apolipoprotein N-acyltransferase [Gemmatimonadota bacterium]
MKHPILPRGAELGLPVVSGILLSLSFPPLHLLVPPFVALVPYLVFVARAPQDREGSASVRRATFWMGIVYFGTLLYWLFTALVFYTWLALLGYIIAVIILSGILAVGGWGIHLLRWRHALPFWISVPVFWTAAEWVRAHLGDVAFPWLGLGHSLTGYPALVGFADLTGARGVTLWLAAINGLLAEWWIAGLRVGWRQRALGLGLLILVPLGYSLLRWSTLETRPAARVLVVQPNIPEDLKLDRDAAVDSSRTALESLTGAGLAGASDLDLIVWPETAIPTFYTNVPEFTAQAARTARADAVGLLTGVLDYERYEDGGYDYYNAALFIDPRGRPVGLYHKHYLVPIVERVPFAPIGWIRSLRRKEPPLIGGFLRWFGGFGRGDEEPVFRLDGSGFGVLICYESIFPGLTRRYRRAGADFIVNITNDAWFGRERPWWSRTSALYQHPAHLVMRAIENRVGVARAANTGISQFVDPRGRVHQATKLFVPDTRIANVETTDGLTLYSRLGDWPGSLAALGALLLLGWSRWQRRRRGAGSGIRESGNPGLGE